MHIRNHGNNSRILVSCLVNFPTQYNQMHKQHSSILVSCLGNFPTQLHQIHEQHTLNVLIAYGFYLIRKHYSYSCSLPRKPCENLSAFSGKFSRLIKTHTNATHNEYLITNFVHVNHESCVCTFGTTETT